MRAGFPGQGPGGAKCAPEFRQVVSRFNGLAGRRIDNSGMRIRLCFTLLALASGVALADSPAARADSLYARLGGTTRVTAIIEATIEHASIAADKRPLVRDQWVAQICAISGGGCRVADAPTPDIFAGAIEELRRAMRAHAVPLAARNELLELLAAHPRGFDSP